MACAIEEKTIIMVTIIMCNENNGVIKNGNNQKCVLSVCSVCSSNQSK